MPKHETVNHIEAQGAPLGAGDLIPRFEGRTIDGRRLRYEDVWQRRNIVVFALPATALAKASSYLDAVEARVSTLVPDDTTVVICDRAIDGVPLGAVVIADRWGEIAHIQPLASDPAEWPSVDDILDWVEFIRIKCPECPP